MEYIFALSWTGESFANEPPFLFHPEANVHLVPLSSLVRLHPQMNYMPNWPTTTMTTDAGSVVFVIVE